MIHLSTFLEEISGKISITTRFDANFSYLFGVKLKFSLVEILRDYDVIRVARFFDIPKDHRSKNRSSW